jgi:histidine triad (HIT) family protein
MHDDCPFCKIVMGEMKVREIYRDNNTVAFVDNLPRFAQGQCVVIHRRHVEQFYELEDREIAELFGAVKQVAKKLKKAYDPQFVSVFSRGQTVPHAHIIVFPSQPMGTMDGFLKSLYFAYQLGSKSGESNLDETAKLIKDAEGH